MSAEPLTIKDVILQTGGIQEIHYKDLTVVASLNQVKDAIGILSALSRTSRRDTMKSIQRSLDQAYAEFQAGVLSQEHADQCATDLAIWFAYQVIIGNAKLDNHTTVGSA